LEEKDDGFSVVSEYFGRNVFNRVVLLGDKPLDSKQINTKKF